MIIYLDACQLLEFVDHLLDTEPIGFGAKRESSPANVIAGAFNGKKGFQKWKQRAHAREHTHTQELKYMLEETVFQHKVVANR